MNENNSIPVGPRHQQDFENNVLAEFDIGHHQSMSPMFHADDRVVVVQVNSADVRPGDVLVYKKAGLIFAHRCIAHYKNPQGWHFLTKGDNLAFVDRPAVPDRIILGRVKGIKRGGRYIDLECRALRLRNRLVALLSFCQAWVSGGLQGRRRGVRMDGLAFAVYKRILSWIFA